MYGKESLYVGMVYLNFLSIIIPINLYLYITYNNIILYILSDMWSS